MTAQRSSVMDTVRDIVGKQLKLNVLRQPPGPEDDLWGLGMTSVTCLGLMLTIEDTFGIELPEDALKESTFRNLRAITTAVESVMGLEPVEDATRS